jgi:hypothetical protein
MLVYHPAFDLHHCTFRILQILFHSNQSKIEIDKVRIWDFYYVFPYEVAKNITFVEELRPLRKIFKNGVNPYEEILDIKNVFDQMQPYQIAALSHLASHELIDPKLYKDGLVDLQKQNIPSELATKLTNISDKEANIIKLMNSPFNDLPLYGKLGFKSRTGLLDFKYDRH